MKTDKNTIIGFVLLGILFFVFFWYTNKQQQAVVAAKQREADSIARVNASRIKPVDPVIARLDSLKTDSLVKASAAGDFVTAALGTEQTVALENEVMKITFTNKGAQPKMVELKQYQAATNGRPVVLGGSAGDNLSYSVNTAANHASSTAELFFTPSQPVKNADGSQVISFSLTAPNGEKIVHQYTLRPNNYLVDWNVSLQGADKLLTQGSMNISWNYALMQQQASAVYERKQTRLCYVQDGSYDYTIAAGGKKEELKHPTDWIALKQQFFNATLIAKNKFQSGSIQLTQQADSSNELFASEANVKVQVPVAASVTVPFQLYYGPNDYHILKSLDNKMENIVDLGSGIFSFVKYINRWIIMPVFSFFASLISNYGWVIALLTLFIRLITSPLTYTSYVSGAKMKVLRPELDALKKKFGTDQQGFAMEQMKLFREAGVNPLGGCIPALLQIPIFFALYSFFSSNIDLRGKSFLWSHDLSAYDIIAKLPFNVPFGFGDHISLFTLTAILTSFLISVYNMSMTPDQNNPALKYMPYIFPFVLLFVFNGLPSALTWYYTVSNLITLGLQFVIQHYIIDHDKILAKIDEKRKTPKTKSKWQERYGQMMEAQKKIQEMKDRSKKG